MSINASSKKHNSPELAPMKSTGLDDLSDYPDSGEKLRASQKYRKNSIVVNHD